MSGVQIELDILYKKVSVNFFYLIISILGSFSIFYEVEDLFPFNYFTISAVLFHIIIFYIPYRLDYSSIKLLIPGYLVIISLFLYPIIILFWKAGQVTAFMWYLLIPLGAMVFFTFRVFLFWSIAIIVLACSVFFVSPFVPDQYIVGFTTRQLYIINIMTIVFCLIFILYFLFYLNRLNQIRMTTAIEERSDNHILEENENDREKYIGIYGRILDYFEKEKPYCNPDFTISQLAAAINSNVTYISKAINIERDINFNILINTYRINRIKDMLESDYQNKYTIQHIYMSAGFRHQSTFNKIFKQIEGVTPSEYIKNMQGKKETE